MYFLLELVQGLGVFYLFNTVLYSTCANLEGFVFMENLNLF